MSHFSLWHTISILIISISLGFIVRLPRTKNTTNVSWTFTLLGSVAGVLLSWLHANIDIEMYSLYPYTRHYALLAICCVAIVSSSVSTLVANET